MQDTIGQMLIMMQKKAIAEMVDSRDLNFYIEGARYRQRNKAETYSFKHSLKSISHSSHSVPRKAEL